MRNLGDAAWDAIGDDWMCYSCKTEPIRRLQDAHRRATGVEEEGGGTGAASAKQK